MYFKYKKKISVLLALLLVNQINVNSSPKPIQVRQKSSPTISFWDRTPVKIVRGFFTVVSILFVPYSIISVVKNNWNPMRWWFSPDSIVKESKTVTDDLKTFKNEKEIRGLIKLAEDMVYVSELLKSNKISEIDKISYTKALEKVYLNLNTVSLILFEHKEQIIALGNKSKFECGNLFYEILTAKDENFSLLNEMSKKKNEEELDELISISNLDSEDKNGQNFYTSVQNPYFKKTLIEIGKRKSNLSEVSSELFGEDGTKKTTSIDEKKLKLIKKELENSHVMQFSGAVNENLINYVTTLSFNEWDLFAFYCSILLNLLNSPVINNSYIESILQMIHKLQDIINKTLEKGDEIIYQFEERTNCFIDKFNLSPNPPIKYNIKNFNLSSDQPIKFIDETNGTKTDITKTNDNKINDKETQEKLSIILIMLNSKEKTFKKIEPKFKKILEAKGYTYGGPNELTNLLQIGVSEKKLKVNGVGEYSNANPKDVVEMSKSIEQYQMKRDPIWKSLIVVRINGEGSSPITVCGNTIYYYKKPESEAQCFSQKNVAFLIHFYNNFFSKDRKEFFKNIEDPKKWEGINSPCTPDNIKNAKEILEHLIPKSSSDRELKQITNHIIFSNEFPEKIPTKKSQENNTIDTIKNNLQSIFESDKNIAWFRYCNYFDNQRLKNMGLDPSYGFVFRNFFEEIHKNDNYEKCPEKFIAWAHENERFLRNNGISITANSYSDNKNDSNKSMTYASKVKYAVSMLYDTNEVKNNKNNQTVLDFNAILKSKNMDISGNKNSPSNDQLAIFISNFPKERIYNISPWELLQILSGIGTHINSSPNNLFKIPNNSNTTIHFLNLFEFESYCDLISKVLILKHKLGSPFKNDEINNIFGNSIIIDIDKLNLFAKSLLNNNLSDNKNPSFAACPCTNNYVVNLVSLNSSVDSILKSKELKQLSNLKYGDDEDIVNFNYSINQAVENIKQIHLKNPSYDILKLYKFVSVYLINMGICIEVIFLVFLNAFGKEICEKFSNSFEENLPLFSDEKINKVSDIYEISKNDKNKNSEAFKPLFMLSDFINIGVSTKSKPSINYYYGDTNINLNNSIEKLGEKEIKLILNDPFALFFIFMIKYYKGNDKKELLGKDCPENTSEFIEKIVDLLISIVNQGQVKTKT